MPKLEQFEIKKYWQIFSGLKPVENKVNHDQVLPILYNSKLDSSILNKIWFLADIDDDDSLDFEEFVICMRLIFDMVNKNIDSVPDELPEWLIPGSKAKLVKERQRTKQQDNVDTPKQEVPKVDWYISPEDKTLYDQILDSCGPATDGTVTFAELSLALKSKFFNIGSSDMEKAWKLVNPRDLASIDRDPATYFIHCLRQRNDVGALIPSELPPALAEICNKQRVTYDLKSEQADLKRLDKQPINAKNDVSNLEDELAQLESSLDNITSVDNSTSQGSVNISAESMNQFKALLTYMEQQLNNPDYNTSTNVQSVTEDLDNIDQQVQMLETYLQQKKQELQSLKSEINSS
ncbi:Actin cytoskeleton-regulatory complex protein END3 [Nakaseomyces bracarensis]|uniref:Actin cytoskeleton-regulatory complex protein END3 n=1 Tax=Nakaseomyces bracarensis TaxID=273131 RepID=A0ABR4NXU0_9SACH